MFKQLCYELTRSWTYLRINHAAMQPYKIWLPVGLSGLCLFVYYALPLKQPLLGKDGALSAALALMATLPGFYFAGLAAVATFGNDYIDREMADPAPYVLIRTGGVLIVNKLTRRQFISYLFSYLVVVSIAVCAVIYLLNFIEPSISFLRTIVHAWPAGRFSWATIKFIVLLPISLLLSSMVIVTLHGIFFLTERIHQP